MFDTTTGAGGRAERRLRDEEIGWLTTVRSDGQRQAVPVWLLWDGGTFLVYSQEGRQKLRNIFRNPRAQITLNSNATGGDVVRGRDPGRIPAAERGIRLRREVSRRHSPHRLWRGKLRPSLPGRHPPHARALAGVARAP